MDRVACGLGGEVGQVRAAASLGRAASCPRLAPSPPAAWRNSNFNGIPNTIAINVKANDSANRSTNPVRLVQVTSTMGLRICSMTARNWATAPQEHVAFGSQCQISARHCVHCVAVSFLHLAEVAYEHLHRPNLRVGLTTLDELARHLVPEVPIRRLR